MNLAAIIFVVVVTLISTHSSGQVEGTQVIQTEVGTIPETATTERPEVAKLKEFFGDLPAGEYANEFIETSEEYKLDWRLLPAIAFQESTGFKFPVGNNGFGFGCTTGSTCIQYDSHSEAIRSVGKELGQGDCYASLPTEGKLATYNGKKYSGRIIGIMNQIGE